MYDEANNDSFPLRDTLASRTPRAIANGVNVVLEGAVHRHRILEGTALDSTARSGKKGLLRVLDRGRIDGESPVDKESYGNCRVKT